ncbi:MAG: hypothetical protein R3E53_14095 [Myxococcota bacterium]
MPEVHARILFWGIAGAGTTTTLRTIHAKLRPELRGDLRREPTRLDPTVQYEVLPITLGDVGGVATHIELVAVPGSPEHAMTRKQLLDGVDGIVLVLDSSPERIGENAPAIDELRQSLAAYGHRLDGFPIVLQYNKRDIADPFAIEALHRKIGLDQAAVFETIATTGHGVLATLTTISKHVVRARRAGATGAPAPPAAPARPATVPAGIGTAQPPSEVGTARTAAELEDLSGSSHDVLEAAILAEGENEGLDDVAEAVALDFADATQPDWQAVADETQKPEAGLGAALRVVSAGQPEVQADGTLCLPLVLGDEDGRTRSLVLSLRLDALVGDGGD